MITTEEEGRVGAGEAAGLQAILEQFAAFGIKAAGGAGDNACGAWLEDRLTALGFACERQVFEVPFAEVRQATLAVGETTVDVLPQALVVPTGPEGLTAPLRLASGREDLQGSLALLVLPHRRWVSLGDPAVSRPVADAFARGALAVALVTTGPTGEAIALNVSAVKPGFAKPVVILAPKDAQPVLKAAGGGPPATLIVEATVGRRPAYNLIARLDRGAAKTLIVSTPRSGWFDCVAERGSGLAVWLSLATCLARAAPAVNLEFVATSAHEYIYLGGEEYLAHKAPKPSDSFMWVHIGASAAARDWHAFGGLRPLPSADSQRVLTATPEVIDEVRAAFRGLNGLESVYPADRAHAGGELVNVIEAGYAPAIGLYGAHHHFHTRGDDLRCCSGDLVAPVAAAFRAAITRILP